MEHLNAWGSILSGVFTLGLFIVAWRSARPAIREYERRTGLEAAQWLARLFDKFCERDSSKEIRQAIDYEEKTPILALLQKDLQARSQNGAPFSPEEKQLLDKFTDFLNFFELVAYLGKLEQLGRDDVKALFSYYLNRMMEVDHDEGIRNYIHQSGYEYLDALMSELAG